MTALSASTGPRSEAETLPEVTVFRPSLCSTTSPDRSPGSPTRLSERSPTARGHRLSQVRVQDFTDHLDALRREFTDLQAQCAALLQENRRLLEQGGASKATRPGGASQSESPTNPDDAEGKIEGAASSFSLVRRSSLSTFESEGAQNVEDQAVARVRQCFREHKRTGQDLRLSTSGQALLFSTGIGSDFHHELTEDYLLNRQRRWRCRAVDPGSPMRLAFECVTVLVCIHDALVVPFTLAWDPPPSLGMRVSSFCTLTFWFIDMILNFFTGFYREGMLVTDLKEIAFRYMTTFFLIDISINGVDLVSIFMEAVVQHESSSPSLRILRIVKLNRLLRVAVLFNRYKDKLKTSNLDSSSFTMLGLALRLVCILFFLNHLICCGWYWIGANVDLMDTDASWLDTRISSGGLRYRDASVQMQYLTSLHWAFTQMTPGSMAVVPQNSWERAWNCLVLVIGLFVSALLISQLSAKMVRVQALNHDRLHEMELLARFLHEQGVPRLLAMRIRRQVRERATFSKPLTCQDVPPLALLPSTLRHELACSIYSRTFLSHSVFFVWASVEESLIEDMSSRAIDLEAFSRHDDVFVPLQPASKVFNLRVGALVYNRVIFTMQEQSAQRCHSQLGLYGTSSANSEETQQSWGDTGEVTLSPKAWLSMMALWCNWSYVGTCQAKENTELVALQVDRVLEVLERYPALYKINRSYAFAFSHVATDPEHLGLSDLDVMPAQVLMNMELDDRCTFSGFIVDSFSAQAAPSAIDRFAGKRERVKPGDRDRLLQELDDGRCVVTLGCDGQLLRTVMLSVIHLTRENGDIFVKVASLRNGTFVTDCVLPGTKLREKESFRDAAQRLVHDELPLGGGFEWETPIEDNSTAQSATTETRTAYVKMRFTISYSSPISEALKSEASGATGHERDEPSVKRVFSGASRLSKGPSSRSGTALAEHTRRLKVLAAATTQFGRSLSAQSFDDRATVRNLALIQGQSNGSYDRQALYAWLPRHIFSDIGAFAEDLKAVVHDIGSTLLDEQDVFESTFEAAPRADDIVDGERIERANL